MNNSRTGVVPETDKADQRGKAGLASTYARKGVKDTAREKSRRHDLSRAARVIPFFLKMMVKKYSGIIILATILSVLSIAAQLGFLALLPEILNALIPVTSGVETPDGLLSLSNFSPNLILAVLFSLLIVTAITDYFQQRVVARLNINLFKHLMRIVLQKLTQDGAILNNAGQTNHNNSANLFTKGGRYGSLIGYRATRLIRPLLAVPALLIFCFWQSPTTTMVSLFTFLLAVPLHLLLVSRGVDTMRRMLRFGAIHGSSKKNLVTSLIQFPGREQLDLESMQKKYIDDGSEGYLKAYFDRRMLSATSALLNVLTIAFALFFMFLLLANDRSFYGFGVGELVVFVLALRFLIVNIGLIATDLTMISSYTPLCESLYELLCKSSKSQLPVIIETSGKEGSGIQTEHVAVDGKANADITINSSSLTPQLLIFTGTFIPIATMKQLARVSTGDAGWGNAFCVRGIYVSHFDDIRKDLLLEIGSDEEISSIESEILTPESRNIIEVALRKEALQGYDETQWEDLSPLIKLQATLHAAIAANATHIILVGPVQTLFGATEWNSVQSLLSRRGIKTMQFVESPPKGLALPKNVPALFFDGQNLLDLGLIENYRTFLPKVYQQITRWNGRAAQKDANNSEFDDPDDMLGKF